MNSIPTNYSVCQNVECTMAQSCLRRKAYEQLLKTELFLRLINPQKCTNDKSCRFYRNSTPVVFAKGFVNMQSQMYPAQYEQFKNILISHFGRNPYFIKRRGDKPISPKEQDFILNTAKKIGVEKELSFDSYQERLNWAE